MLYQGALSNFAHSISPQLNQKQIPISLIIPSLNPPFSQQPLIIPSLNPPLSQQPIKNLIVNRIIP